MVIIHTIPEIVGAAILRIVNKFLRWIDNKFKGGDTK